MWGLITGSVAGLIDAALILVAYILYPFVVAIFGFFYIFYGSILYIFGPIVIALMPLGATNRLAKAYVENVMIWNAWPILYGGFGALLSAVQMGQVGQMLNQNNFLGGLGNLEGSFLIGAASIIYSLAIAVIPFIAKRIVSGEVGSTAGALIGAAATALTAGAAAVEGVVAGTAAAGAGGAAGASTGGSATSAVAGAGTSAGSNQPAAPQGALRPTAMSPSADGFSGFGVGPTIEGHADQIRNSMSEALGGSDAEAEGQSGTESGESLAGTGSAATSSANTKPNGVGRPSSPARRGPTVHRYNLGTWGTYHAARLVASRVASTVRTAGSQD